MKIVNAKPLVLAAQKQGYAVPAFNTNGGTYDITRAALEAAQELYSPLIVQVYEPNTAYRGFQYFVHLTEWLCQDMEITIPVALQLDHGKSFVSVVQAMKAGLTSVMFDASYEPFEMNVEKTKKIVEIARTVGVSVEAEIGYVKGNEPKQEKQAGQMPVPEKPSLAPGRTDVEEALRFVDQTDVDMLAVAIGTTHGVYQMQTEIDFELLEKLQSSLSTPLVMHGTSGISLGDLEKLAKSGMAKINFGEPLRFNYIKHFNKLTDDMEHLWHPWKIMQEVKNRLKMEMKTLITALGADGKADDYRPACGTA